MPNIFENTIAIQLTFHSFGITRRVKPNEAQAKATSTGETLGADAVSLTKKLIDDPSYTAIGRADYDLKCWLEARSVPSVLRKGTIIISKEAFPEAVERIEAHLEKRPKLVADFLSIYDAVIAAARVRLGPCFDAAQYPPPEEVAARFSVDVQYVDFAVSEGLKTVNASLYEREREKMRARMAEAEEEIRQAMRAALYQTIGHLTDALSGEYTDGKRAGKPRIFRDSAVTNLTEWLDLFSVRNVTNDEELAALVERARAVVNSSDTDPELLRKNMDVRKATAAKLAEVKDALAPLVTDAAGRKFNFAEDDAA